jgi:valyl-tRNA synthetase
MSSFELDKAYDPKKYEAPIYERWEESGVFQPNMDAPKDPFTIIMPPLNANGDLHLGHAMYVIQDIMVRYRRMQGHKTLWLPGTDHAGIETQVVYERELAKTGKSRYDLGREAFYDAALKFTLANQANIIAQLRSLGFSADWSRLKFTLDRDIIATVYATFRQMHDDGLIYRGNRIVNWCTNCQSSFADIEVKFVDRTDSIYTLDYGTVQIATTRPETIFADVAVAVNPEDARFTRLIGQTALIPLTDRPIGIIADDHVAVDFGTGALKVTPAHDKNDYEIGKRHNLPEIQVIDLDGKLINVPDAFAGLSVEAGRAAVVATLQTAGKLVTTTPIEHSVGTHDRCGTVIEPLITEQWYMRVAAPNAKVTEAIESGDIALVPERFKKISLDWLAGEYDWNISRQNWFGIRIPVFYKTSNDPAKEPYLVTDDENEAMEYYGQGNYRAETDVFDTWYSSGQWPYATLQATGDAELGFYPTSVMETGRDILTKWVTKMAMFGIYRTGSIPFHAVYLHGLINDEHGKKMSKSKGNVINPLEMTDKYGTDALRLALTIGITPGNDGSLSETKLEGYRNFCNKLWNVARFILGQLPEDYSPTVPIADSTADAWIAERMILTTQEITTAIEEYRFSEAGQTVYSLLWEDFADWYLEASKVEVNHDMLVFCLGTILKLAHPIAPFVTEAIWEHLPWQTAQLIVAEWPDANKMRTSITSNNHSPHEFESVIAIVNEVRATRANLGLDKIILAHAGGSMWYTNGEVIAGLVRQAELKLDPVSQGLLIKNSESKAWIEVDPKTQAAIIERLGKQKVEQGSYLTSLDAKLANERYIQSAPAAIVQETKDRREETLMLISKLDEQLAAFSPKP